MPKYNAFALLAKRPCPSPLRFSPRMPHSASRRECPPPRLDQRVGVAVAQFHQDALTIERYMIIVPLLCPATPCQPQQRPAVPLKGARLGSVRTGGARLGTGGLGPPQEALCFSSQGSSYLLGCDATGVAALGVRARGTGPEPTGPGPEPRALGLGMEPGALTHAKW